MQGRATQVSGSISGHIESQRSPSTLRGCLLKVGDRSAWRQYNNIIKPSPPTHITLYYNISYTIAMKLTVLHKNRVEHIQELIDIACRNHLSRINSNIHDIKYLIHQICTRNHLTFNIQIGSVCAHVAKHYSPSRMRQTNADLITTQRVIKKFELVFMGKSSTSPFTLQDLVEYGKYCISLTFKPAFRDSIQDKQHFQDRLRETVRHLLSSLLLEYVPVEYSKILLKLYLQDYQSEDQKACIESNKERYQDIYPYHDILQILSSLSYHILNNRKIIDSQHYLQILSHPTPGSVEWPMLLGVRNLHQLPKLL